MIRINLFLFLLVPYFGVSQQVRLNYSNINHDLSLIIVDGKIFDLDFCHNFFDGGTVDMECGIAKIRKRKIVLISKDQAVVTNLQRMVLKRKKNKK